MSTIKKIWNNYAFLIIAFILFGMAMMIEFLFSMDRNHNIDVQRIESVLAKKENTLDSLIDVISNHFEKKGAPKSVEQVFSIDFDYQQLKQEGFSFLVYHKDNLIFWTNNQHLAPEHFYNSEINNRIVSLNNGYWDVRSLSKGEYTIVGLFLLKNKYNIQNNYLENEFCKDFKLASSEQISTLPLSNSFEIRDKEGSYLFSIVPTNSQDSSSGDNIISMIMFLLSMVFVLCFVLSFIEKRMQNNANPSLILYIMGGLIIFRIVTWVLKYPSIIYSSDFFDTIYFSYSSFLFNSLGDTIINSVLLLFLIIYLFRYFEYIKLEAKLAKCNKYLVIFAKILIIFGYFLWINSIISDFVVISKINLELNNLFSLNRLSYGALVCICVFVFGICYLILKAFNITKIYKFVVCVFISAVWFAYSITSDIESNRELAAKDYCKQDFDAHDVVAELLLEEMGPKISSDDFISDLLANRNADTENRLREYILQKYFNGYWSKYDLSLVLYCFQPGESFVPASNEFAHKVMYQGVPVGKSGFYFASDSQKTSVSYMSTPKFVLGYLTYYVCLEVTHKAVPEQLGYPELLLDKQVKIYDKNLEFDYANYRHGKLFSHKGNYPYDLSDKLYRQNRKNVNSKGIGIFEEEEYIHCVFVKDEITNVVTRKRTTMLDYVVMFAYLFVCFVFSLLVYMLIKMLKDGDKFFFKQIKTRLILFITLILLTSFVLICIGTTQYTVSRKQIDNHKKIDERMHSVYMHMEDLLGDSHSIDVRFNLNQCNFLDENLVKLSNLFFIDINLYSNTGRLIASSRPEIFKQGLQGTLMNSLSIKKLAIDKKANCLLTENIGSMSFASAYIPFFNKHDELIAYINMPYFTSPEDLQNELSTQLVSLINLLVVILMISIFCGVFISEKLVQPIKMIQAKMKEVDLGQKHNKIEYNYHDELGQLIVEYNKMVDKLQESANNLAQAERESAWKESAKQFAHEVKNPLTPMKLNIQLLMRSHQNNDKDFDQRLVDVSQSLIQQIDTLSAVATQYSTYAKIPDPINNPFDIIEVVDNVIELFKSSENVELSSNMNGLKELIINADKEQLSRVFINLIKNAVQAIPEGIKGKIHVEVTAKDKFVCKITDNGCGIPEEIRNKIFAPSFTTKSSGSGLGLSMCRTMVRNAHGNITFETVLGQGTTFIVELPLNEN